jgi:hypothetical protein
LDFRFWILDWKCPLSVVSCLSRKASCNFTHGPGTKDVFDLKSKIQNLKSKIFSHVLPSHRPQISPPDF